jgi:hypothetical protein
MASRQKKSKKNRIPSRPIPMLAASWSTTYSDELWNRINRLKGAGVVVRNRLPDGQSVDAAHRNRMVFVGPAFDDSNVAGSAVCLLQPKRKALYWTFSIYARPDEKPPAQVAKNNRKIGGKPGIAAFLNAVLGSESTPVGTYRAVCTVDAKDWQCVLLPRALSASDRAVADFGEEGYFEEVGYRFKGGVIGIQEVSLLYDHRRNRTRMEVQGESPVKIASECDLPIGRDMFDFVFERLFKPLAP